LPYPTDFKQLKIAENGIKSSDLKNISGNAVYSDNPG
jgi:hypothetical protein